MYYCLYCNKEFEAEDLMREHLSVCWKELHPFHKSKEAPHSDAVVVRKNNNDVINFLKEIRNGRSSH